MKVYILVDNNSIVRCIATEECNLHKDKLHMEKYHVDFNGICGDEYDPVEDKWIKRPENYRQPTKKEINDRLIADRMNEIVRKQAIDELIAEGKLPPDFPENENA